MKKTIIPLIISTLFVGGLYAQQITGIAVFSKIGYTSLSGSASTLNKIAPSYRGFSNDFVTAGAEAYYRTNKIILALDGSIGLQNAKSTPTKWTDVSAGSAYARFGWIITEKRHYWIYPSIGLGIAGIDINTHNYETDEVTNLKNKLLSSPSFDVGFNADYIVNKIIDPEGYGTLFFGLRTGYRLSIKSCEWWDNDGNKIKNMPSYGYNGFYIMVTIGGGGFVRK